MHSSLVWVDSFLSRCERFGFTDNNLGPSVELLFTDADDTFYIAFWLTVIMFSNLFYHNNMKPNIISELDRMTNYLFRKLLT